ncbi:MAG: PCRF domain-containing protein, partial [Acidobacteria bacterium]|nr:PCRF domain-containing protein [Acidobacteriota bacterium]
MLEKLEQTEARYEELTAQLSLPEVYSDQAAYARLAKQHRAMGEMVEKYREWKAIKEELAGARELFEAGGDDEE